MEHTKEELFEYMALPYWKMTAQQVKLKLQKSNCKMPFVSEQWKCYIKALTGWPPCVYCDAPRALIVTNNGFVDSIAQYKCVDVPKGHTLMMRTHRIKVWQGMTEDAALEFMMRKCEHGRLKFDCLVCIEKVIQWRLYEQTHQ